MSINKKKDKKKTLPEILESRLEQLEEFLSNVKGTGQERYYQGAVSSLNDAMAIIIPHYGLSKEQKKTAKAELSASKFKYFLIGFLMGAITWAASSYFILPALVSS